MDRNKNAVWSFVISLALVSALCIFFEPTWESNDDIAMSMVAHGYGLAAISSPSLIFSNILWGYLVQTIPQVNGVLGYSIATLTTIVVFGAIVLFSLRKVGHSWLLSFAVCALLLVRPVLFPQFTINAGLLTVGAFVYWYFYGIHGNKFDLVVGCLFAFFGYLIRSQEFFLVLLIATPLLPWRKLAKDHFSRIALCALSVGILGAMYADYQAYQGDEWREFNALNPVRAQFTDWGAGKLLKENTDILTQYKYSENDITLLENWFFVDPSIANPDVLNSILVKLGPIPNKQVALKNGWAGIRVMTHSAVLPLFLMGLILLMLTPNRKLILAWVGCLLTFFAIGLLGRPGFLRIYVPVLSLLVIAPLLIQHKDPRHRGKFFHLLIYASVIVALINAINSFSESIKIEARNVKIRHDFSNFPTAPVVVWGSAFPYESIFKVLSSTGELNYKLYGLGTFTLAPFGHARRESQNGRGLVDLLRSSNGVIILAVPRQFKLLEIYCEEHFNQHLQIIDVTRYGELEAKRLSCY